MDSANSPRRIMMNGEFFSCAAFFAFTAKFFNDLFLSFRLYFPSSGPRLFSTEPVRAFRPGLSKHRVFVAQFTKPDLFANFRAFRLSAPVWAEDLLCRLRRVSSSFFSVSPLRFNGLRSVSNFNAVLNEESFNTPGGVTARLAHNPSVRPLFYDVPLGKVSFTNVDLNGVRHGR